VADSSNQNRGTGLARKKPSSPSGWYSGISNRPPIGEMTTPLRSVASGWPSSIGSKLAKPGCIRNRSAPTIRCR